MVTADREKISFDEWRRWTSEEREYNTLFTQNAILERLDDVEKKLDILNKDKWKRNIYQFIGGVAGGVLTVWVYIEFYASLITKGMGVD